MNDALVAYVNADATVAGLQANRFYHLRLPDEAVLPASTFQRIDASRVYAHATAGGLPRARYQLTHWGATPMDAQALADAIRHRLDGFHGTMSGVRVDSVECVDGPDLDDPETQTFRSIRDYFMQHTEV
jgi:Protein of unknown function (DUF3168)